MGMCDSLRLRHGRLEGPEADCILALPGRVEEVLDARLKHIEEEHERP